MSTPHVVDSCLSGHHACHGIADHACSRPGRANASDIAKCLKDEARHARYLLNVVMDRDVDPIGFETLLRPVLAPGILAISAITPTDSDKSPSAFDLTT